jgi:D-arabinose 1-dehydrogenase-like Zn-dependent alcohol dehydrogenase
MAALGIAVSAVTCLQPHEPLVIQEIELPPLGDDEVEVRVEYCGICASGKINFQTKTGLPSLIL